MIRGIGNPLIAVYARCYLCRVGLALNKTSDFKFVKENFHDFLFTYQQLFESTVQNELVKQNVTLHSYLNLYSPALDWIMQVLVATLPESLLEEVLSRCKKQENRYYFKYLEIFNFIYKIEIFIFFQIIIIKYSINCI